MEPGLIVIVVEYTQVNRVQASRLLFQVKVKSMNHQHQKQKVFLKSKCLILQKKY